MMELLLDRMNASIEEHMQEMTARMEINQAKLEADRKADQGHMQNMLAKMDTNQEKVYAIHKEMMAKIDDNQKRMEAAVQSIRSERDETIQQRVENVMMRVIHETQSLQNNLQEDVQSTAPGKEGKVIHS
jgi:hypothetical protein